MATARRFGRSFYLIWTFYFLSFTAVYQLLPTLPFHLRDLGVGLAESGRFTTTFMVGSGAGALFTGLLGDRYGQKRVLNVATLLAAGCFLLYALFSRPWMFLSLGLAHGVVWSGFRTATLTWVGGHLPEEQRVDGLALFGMAAPGGAALGPLLGLLLLPHLGFRWLMVSLAGLILVLNVLVARLPDMPQPQKRPPLEYRWPGNWLVMPMLILACLALSYGPMPSYSAQEARALGFAWPSALLSCYAMGMVLMRLGMAVRGIGSDPQRLMVPMLVMVFLAAVALAVMPGGLLRHILSGAFYGAGFGMVHTLLFAHAMVHAKPDQRGVALGTQYFAYDAGIGLGSLVMGFPMELMGFRWGWGFGALALGLALVLGIRLRRSKCQE